MTPEEKQLLLKDLCARLPYGVKVLNTLNGEVLNLGKYLYCLPAALTTNFKPYLRPMSSMTEKEKEELVKMSTHISSIVLTEELGDWLNAHHFDYRDLIPKGLALEAPAGMYKTE